MTRPLVLKNTISLKVNDRQLAALKAKASDRDCSASDIIREFIDELATANLTT